ncbi:lipocalin family protein [Desulfohalovibrio reitneri]|uniref:lipocalin family protein n=1 Tax=Desulfohalovibrio reitneri TaxID=1307759 RepID=UPI0009DCCBF7|nr:lipocalin family protein [Desulfohalovibrio reitneri]
MRRAALLVLTAALALGAAACGPPPPPLPTAENVDLSRYMGRWYAVQHIPTSFEAGCACTRADYTPLEDGRVGVVNTCFKDGEWEEAEGVARRKEPDDPSRLEVSFFGPFWGDYHILAVDNAYRHALVGAPDRDYLWILARSPEADPAVIERFREKAARLGFDTRRLRPVPRTGCPPRQEKPGAQGAD